jgi:hypothetical protein
MTGPTNELTRRRFIEHAGLGAIGLVGSLAGMSRIAWSAAGDNAAITTQPPALPIALLEKSPFVYISPLLANSKDSRCHAELWYAWLDDSVVVTVASSGWKARSLGRGLDRARIWVGAYGRWKTMIGPNNEAFRGGPSFEARAEKIDDPKMIERLLASYDQKYPAEIASWRDKMRRGNADGSRIMIRYTPIVA